MSNRLVFVRLLKTINDMEKDVGLSEYTANEQQIYAAVFLLSKDTHNPEPIHKIRSHYLVFSIPIPSVYRSFARLIDAKKIRRIGSDRSGLYAINT